MIVLSLLLFGHALCAQLTPDDARFFRAQLPVYRAWLADKELDPLLSPEAIFVDSVLVVTHRLKSAAGFDQLLDHYQTEYGEALPDLLLTRLAFIMDVEKDELIVEAESEEAFIMIYREQGQTVVEREKKMGSNVDEDFTLPLDALDNLTLRGYCEVDGRSIEFIKTLLIDKLRLHYQRYETGLFEAYQFRVIDNYENDLILEISNVSKVVLTDSYFEHLRFDIEIQPGRDEAELQIEFTVQGKYAAGVFWAPRDARYKDMEKKYAQRVEDFAKSFRNQLIAFLK